MSKRLWHIWEAFTCIVREPGFDLFASHEKCAKNLFLVVTFRDIIWVK